MDQKNLPLSLFFVGIYAVAYFYLKHSGLWVRYRWTGLVFGAAWGVVYFLLRKAIALMIWDCALPDSLVWPE